MGSETLMPSFMKDTKYPSMDKVLLEEYAIEKRLAEFYERRKEFLFQNNEAMSLIANLSRDDQSISDIRRQKAFRRNHETVEEIAIEARRLHTKSLSPLSSKLEAMKEDFLANLNSDE